MSDFQLLPPQPRNKGKIDLDLLKKLHFVENKSQQECAALFKVNVASISKALKKIRGTHPIPVMTDHQHELIKYSDDIIKQLRKYHKILVTELKFIQDYMNRVQKPEDRILLHPTLYKSIETIIKLINEIREQYKMAAATEAVNQFIDEVCHAIRGVSPSLQHEIFSRLQDKGILFQALVGDTERTGQRTISFG